MSCRTLLLYWHPPRSDMRLAVNRHLHALEGRGHELVYYNAYRPPPTWLRWVRPDAVVLHTTFLCLRWMEEFPRKRAEYAWLGGLRCPKLALPQDEYDHAEVLEEWLTELGVTTVFSCFGAEHRATLYPRLQGQAEFVKALTGYIDDAATRGLAPILPDHHERPFDVVYRATKLPYWFGTHGQLKHRIAEIVEERAHARGLRTDISTAWEKTVFGEKWLEFVMSGRSTIGTESGSSVLDRRGEIQLRIRSLLKAQPTLTFEEVDARMPAGWDAYSFFAVSPRHLEAVTTKTCQILIEGSYDGILTPNVHYVPVRSDLSDIDRALDRIADVDEAAEIAQRAYDDVYALGAYSLDRFALELERAIGGAGRGRRPPLPLLVGAIAPAETIARAPFRLLRPAGPPSARRVKVNLMLLFGRALLTNRALRRLALRAIRTHPRPRLRHVVGDVARLEILRRVYSGRTQPAEWTVSPERANGVLIFRSRPAARTTGSATKVDAEALNGIVWDHSAVAAIVPVPGRDTERGAIPLGRNGSYEFTTLSGSSRLRLRRDALLAIGVEPEKR